MATYNIQLENHSGDLLMPKTAATVVDYDKTYSALNATTTQTAIDTIVDGVWDEGNFQPGASLITSSIWSRYVTFTIDTTAGTAVASSNSIGGYSQILLPPDIISIRLTVKSTTTIIREFSNVPRNKSKVVAGDTFGFVKSQIVNQADDVATFTVSDRANRICINIKSGEIADIQSKLASIEYTTRACVVPKLMRHDDTVMVVGEMCFGAPGSTHTVHTDIGDFNIWTNNTTRYRPWVNVAGKCKIKITVSPESINIAGNNNKLRVVGYVSANTDIVDISNPIKNHIFDANHLVFEYDNWKGDAVMAFFNLSVASGTISDAQIASFWESGISIEYYDRDTKYGDYPINVRKFGAVGDGVANDSKAIQTALDIGGTVFIPGGTYKLNTGLLIGDHTHLIMESDTVLLRGVAGDSASRFCIIDTRNDINETEYNGRHDIVIEGGTLDLSTAYNTGGVGIGLQHARNVIIRNVTICNAQGHNIDIGGCENVTIEGCTFRDHLPAGDSLECVQIDAMGGYGAWPFPPYTNQELPCFDNTPTRHLEIKGCRFHMNNLVPAIGNHNGIRHYDINIHNNFFFGAGRATGSRGVIGFRLNGNNHNETDLVYIHDNYMRDCKYGFQIVSRPINESSRDNIGRIIIKNNIMVNIPNMLTPDSSNPDLSYVHNEIIESNIILSEPEPTE